MIQKDKRKGWKKVQNLSTNNNLVNYNNLKLICM